MFTVLLYNKLYKRYIHIFLCTYQILHKIGQINGLKEVKVRSVSDKSWVGCPRPIFPLEQTGKLDKISSKIQFEGNRELPKQWEFARQSFKRQEIERFEFGARTVFLIYMIAYSESEKGWEVGRCIHHYHRARREKETGILGPIKNRVPVKHPKLLDRCNQIHAKYKDDQKKN